MRLRRACVRPAAACRQWTGSAYRCEHGFCPALTEEMEREKSVYSDELLASQSRREPEAQPWSWFRWFLSCCSCCVFIPQYPPRRLWHESPQGKERKRRGEMTEGEAGEDQGASAPLAMLPTEGIQQPLL
ncbi:hypothetical protein WJX84_011263 [Apatococcus fuscideae]|uniref:Uncharacterized protein n=1 Tax=Apatococcus fuscideae TaxID=2026836 RepID=A0AAW1T0C1_9CHLO